MNFRSFFLIITFASAAFAQDAAPAPVNTPTGPAQYEAWFARGYTLGPGDEVAGGALGELGYDFVGTVDEDGMIRIPFITDRMILAQCRTVREIQADIETDMRKFLRDPHFSFRVVEKRSRPPVTVWGEVVRPSEITLTRTRTLVEILSVAQGIKEDSASGLIEITRPKRPLCMSENDPNNWGSNKTRIFSYAKLKNGDADSNPTIFPGDVINVLKAPPVYVTGEVVGGQGVYLREDGLSLTEAMGKVGGPRQGANLKTISIYRLKAGATPASKDRELISANYKYIRQGKEQDVMLQPYDIVIVDKAGKSVGEILTAFAMRAGETGVSAFGGALPYRIIY